MVVVGARAGCDSPSEVRRKPRVRARREAAVVFDVREDAAPALDAVPEDVAAEMFALMDVCS